MPVEDIQGAEKGRNIPDKVAMRQLLKNCVPSRQLFERRKPLGGSEAVGRMMLEQTQRFRAVHPEIH
jgi:hypothetical protein